MNNTDESSAHWQRFVAYMRQLVARMVPGRRGTAHLEEFLAFLDQRAWQKAYVVLKQMPESLARTPRVRQQYGFALNRDGQSVAAETVLRELLEEDGPSAETCGILGRVYKDRWRAARQAGQTQRAAAMLYQAVEIYLQGHEADPANPYPGINALTLMSHYPRLPRRIDSLQREIATAVATRRRAARPTYWDHATRLELALHTGDTEEAQSALADALAADKGPWMMDSTLANLHLGAEAREEHGEAPPDWLPDAEARLEEAIAKLTDADELTRIEGIGPKASELLRAAAIHTFTDLADADVGHLRQILSEAGFRFALADPRTWPEQAALAAAGRWRELDKLQRDLVGGRRLL